MERRGATSDTVAVYKSCAPGLSSSAIACLAVIFFHKSMIFLWRQTIQARHSICSLEGHRRNKIQ
jgi:hypothetical protein